MLVAFENSRRRGPIMRAGCPAELDFWPQVAQMVVFGTFGKEAPAGVIDPLSLLHILSMLCV